MVSLSRNSVSPQAPITLKALIKQSQATTDFYEQMALWWTEYVLYRGRVYQLCDDIVDEPEFSPYGRGYYYIADDTGTMVEGTYSLFAETAWRSLPGADPDQRRDGEVGG